MRRVFLGLLAGAFVLAICVDSEAGELFRRRKHIACAPRQATCQESSSQCGSGGPERCSPDECQAIGHIYNPGWYFPSYGGSTPYPNWYGPFNDQSKCNKASDRDNCPGINGCGNCRYLCCDPFGN